MVDLPLPDSPTSPSTSPRLISKLTLLTAFTGSTPLPWENQVHKSLTRINGSTVPDLACLESVGIAASSFFV